MLVIKIELWPWGNQNRAKKIGEIRISNDGSGGDTRGDYDVTLMTTTRNTTRSSVWRQGRVLNFPRLSLNCYDLLYRALEATVSDRNRRTNARPSADRRDVKDAGENLEEVS